jgi:hypothetical protein
MDERRRTHRPLGGRPRGRTHLAPVPPPDEASAALTELRRRRPSRPKPPEDLEALVTTALESFRWSLAGGFRHQEHDDHVLAHALRAVGRNSGSIHYVSPYGLHVVFGSDPPDDPAVPTVAWRRLPYLLGAYARHLHHLDEHPDEVVTLAVLDEIDKGVAHWDHAVDEHGRRRTSSRPIWQAQLDELAVVVGGHDLLAALDAEPLPDDHLDLLAVDPAVVDRTLLVSSYCDDWFDGIRRDHSAPMLVALAQIERRFGEDPRRLAEAARRIELRTAARRLVGRLARSAPEKLRGRPKPQSLAAAVCWAVERGNALRPQRAPTAGAIAGAVGGSAAGVRRRAHEMLEALGAAQPEGFLDRRFSNHLRPVLGSPDLLDARMRGALMERASALRARLADPDEPS